MSGLYSTSIIFAHQYGGVAPLVYFPKTNMVGEKIESFIECRTNLFIPDGKQMAAGEVMIKEAQNNTSGGGEAEDAVAMEKSKDNEVVEDSKGRDKEDAIEAVIEAVSDKRKDAAVKKVSFIVDICTH